MPPLAQAVPTLTPLRENRRFRLLFGGNSPLTAIEFSPGAVWVGRTFLSVFHRSDRQECLSHRHIFSLTPFPKRRPSWLLRKSLSLHPSKVPSSIRSRGSASARIAAMPENPPGQRR